MGMLTVFVWMVVVVGVVVMVMAVLMIVIVAMRMRVAVVMMRLREDATAGADKHPARHSHHERARDELKIGLGLLGGKPAGIMQSDERQRPNDGGVRKGGGQAQQHGLPHRAAYGDDERGHHGFAVARLKTVKRTEGNGGGYEQPGIALRQIFRE